MARTRSEFAPPTRTWEWGLAGVGAAAAVLAAAAAPAAALSAAAQDWPAFVLVAGLLLVGVVAHEDGLFQAGGQALARLTRSGFGLYASACVLILVVTSLLNLDTSVTFLTPVLVGAAWNRGQREMAVLSACVLISNAGSMLLPGSNLTNVIVLGHLHLSGRAFFDHMAAAGVAAAAATALVIAVAHRHELRAATPAPTAGVTPVFGVGALAVAAVTILVLVLPMPALPVAVVGVAAVLVRRGPGAVAPRTLSRHLGVPVLAGLFGLAVALGTLGRHWSGPVTLLSHFDEWETAAFAAVVSVLVNNLPAASLLAARRPPEPFALLVGLNVGPNLFLSGSLAWFLWLRAARAAGAHPHVRRTVVLGVVSAPLAMAAALGVLAAQGVH